MKSFIVVNVKIQEEQIDVILLEMIQNVDTIFHLHIPVTKVEAKLWFVVSAIMEIDVLLLVMIINADMIMDGLLFQISKMRLVVRAEKI